MNSLAPLITKNSGSQTLNSGLQAQYLGSGIQSGYQQLNDSGFSMSRLGSSEDDLSGDGVIRGGVPARGGISQQTQTDFENFSNGAIAQSNNPAAILDQVNPLHYLEGIVSSLSQGVSRALVAKDTASAESKMTSNLTQHGPGLIGQTSAIRQNDQARVNYGQAGAAFGSILGPLGALGGYYLGKSLAPQNSQYTISSFSGKISPDSEGVAYAHSSDTGLNSAVLSS